MTLGNPKFITVEGVDGAGKSSHVQNIGRFFEAAGYEVVYTREPGGTPLGEHLRELLLRHPMDPLAETMIMFAARREHVQQVIEPALAAGKVVVCDRFTDSSWAYQGGGKGIAPEALNSLELLAHDGLQPGLTILFDLPVELSLKRLEGTGKDPDKFESAGPEFFQSVREAYHVRMAENPRIHAIDSSKTLPECVEDVAKILSDYLPTMKASAKQTPSRRF